MQSISKQQQQLNQVMQQMMEQGQQPNGEQMSQMAGQQERIRQQLAETEPSDTGNIIVRMNSERSNFQDTLDILLLI